MSSRPEKFADATLPRDRDQFLRELVREMSGLLEDTIGLEETSGFVSMVAARISERMNAEYRELAQTDRLTLERVAEALVDLKRRIGGGFSVKSIDERKIVLLNTACPFGEHVEGRRSLCMMTSNIFGRIAADNLGYARVEVAEAIAAGDGRCRLVIYFDEGEAGREYFGQ